MLVFEQPAVSFCASGGARGDKYLHRAVHFRGPNRSILLSPNGFETFNRSMRVVAGTSRYLAHFVHLDLLLMYFGFIRAGHVAVFSPAARPVGLIGILGLL